MIKIINDKTIVQYILFYYEDYQVLYLVFENKQYIIWNSQLYNIFCSKYGFYETSWQFYFVIIIKCN